MKKNIMSCCRALVVVLLIVLFVQIGWAVDVQMNGDVNATGSITAATFYGSGVGLTGISSTNISNSAITVNQLADNAVQSAKIANDAVTPGKIAFYGRVAIVDVNAGGNSIGYYTDPAYAMSHYSEWCTGLSSTTPCLLKIMPGVYNVGTTSVQMQPYIDIEGSGENTTIIQGNINSDSGVVRGANYAEIRFLTVKNTGGGSYSVAFYNNAASPKITNVTATASGGTYLTHAVSNRSSSSPAMTNVNVTASGGSSPINIGVYNDSSSPVMTNVNATATTSGGMENYGVYNASSSPVMTNVTVTVTSSGGNSCIGVYNDSSSPAMTNVTATASGGSCPNPAGVSNHSSSPAMTNVTATASGGSSNRGVWNNNSSPVMTNVIATASAGTVASSAVYNDSSSPVMTNVTATASGSSLNFGVLNFNSGTVKINHSVIKGSTDTINNNSGVITSVGNTQLDGGTVYNLGTLTCAGVYDGNYTFYANTCP